MRKSLGNSLTLSPEDHVSLFWRRYKEALKWYKKAALQGDMKAVQKCKDLGDN